MREIKFRVWDKRKEKGISTKEMLYDAQKHHLWYDALDYSEVYAVMQFTGLKDKNGREIYEGDILKSFNCLIRVEFFGGCFYGNWYNDATGNMINAQLNINNQDSEIIGNIFENPELLNEKTV